MKPHHTTYAAGPTELIARIAANYQCGHCNSETEARTDQHGTIHLVTHHDDGCPVLEGTLSAIPDTLRAANTP
ncbi:hypothetical protein ADK55_19140 [Streptomyces sp. WM4235]|uniref:hypothetical protein n=1 Tax=Streptomyces sp. WM4235 TaxID=1415551 RepID=UPI0006AE5A89|nr:hypothetical protein [Streptomyces sp. WM4235]KOU48985.1 hypothetical protein ADK55_19140 [Streptomyces sp. WM4235]